MGKLILVTGGARSGKSSFAEETAKKLGDRILYIATAIPFDEEMKLRVKKHREQRPEHWTTLEAYKDMGLHLEEHGHDVDGVMLDCVTIMVTNIMFERDMDWDKLKAEDIVSVEECVRQEVEKLIAGAQKLPVPLIAVTNELGMGIVPENALARVFRDVAGRMNQIIAREADEVYFCVSGIPMKIK